MSYVRFYSSASFTLETNGNTKIWNGTASNAMEYSINGSTWISWDGTTTISSSSTASSGKYNLYLRGTGNTKVSNSTNTTSSTKFIFTGTQPIDSEGSTESLLDYQTVDNNQHPTMSTYAFACLFYDQTLLRSAPVLGSTTMTRCCYYRMFYGCTSLIKAPELPATTLDFGCYQHMFYGCSSLISTPALNAEILTDSCYEYMFRDCTSLVFAPKLGSTSLGEGCYYGMFYGCTSLTIPPELPATALSDFCYAEMFRNSGIELSATQVGRHTLPYRIPASGTGTAGEESVDGMFYGSGVNTPSINTTYYVKDKQYKATSVELIAIADRIRSSNDINISLTYPDDYIEEINKMGNSKCYSGNTDPSTSLGKDGDLYIDTRYLST